MERATKACQVVVVEDDADVRSALADLLEEEGYAVAVAHNGSAALAALQTLSQPKLIILDLMMPEMNGWELLHQLKADARLADVPVAVLSAVAAFEQRRGKLDVAAVLPKPVDAGQLLQIVARFCM